MTNIKSDISIIWYITSNFELKGPVTQQNEIVLVHHFVNDDNNDNVNGNIFSTVLRRFF